MYLGTAPSRDQECPGCPRSSTPEIFLKDRQTHQRNFERVECGDGKGDGFGGDKEKRGSDFLPREIDGKNRMVRIRRRITAAYERARCRAKSS